MKIKYEIEPGLLEVFIDEVKAKHLPVHIQRSMKRVDENGSEVEIAEFEYPDYFDFNAAMRRVINQYCRLTPPNARGDVS